LHCSIPAVRKYAPEYEHPTPSCRASVHFASAKAQDIPGGDGDYTLDWL